MIISLAIQKGGSGKTTTAVNMAAVLRDTGKRVLLIDIDPQANLTQSMGIMDDHEPNIYHLLRALSQGKDINTETAIIEANGIALIPSSLELASAELELVSTYGRERLLAQILEDVNSQYDYIIIDCPPSIGMLTVNAITASDYVIVPLQAEFLPLKGLESFMKSLSIIKKQLNPGIEVLGYLLTKYDKRKTMSQSVLQKLTEQYGDKVFKTSIRSNIALAQAQEKGVDIFTYNKTFNGAVDYKQFVKELIGRINNRKK